MSRNDFPIIEHINDVLPSIRGKDEFVVAQRDWGTVIDYRYVDKNTFDSAMAYECRGLKFDTAGKLIGRPLHKFKNVGESDDTQALTLPWETPHVVLEKLDGSMVHPVKVGGGMAWMTRMGLTDVSMEAAKRLTPAILNFSAHFLNYGVTPIFEWISPKNRIVIPYDRDELVLIAMREMRSGKYRSYDEMRVCVRAFSGDIPLVKAWSENISDVAALIAHTRGLKDQEGYVVRWSDGHMVKMKADDYVAKHKTKDGLTWEKDVLALCLAGKVDDVRPLLSAEDANALDQYNSRLNVVVENLTDNMTLAIGVAKAEFGEDRKRFALERVPSIFRPLRSVAFRVWAGEDPQTEIRSLLSKHTGSRTQVDEIRPLLDGLQWERRTFLEAA